MNIELTEKEFRRLVDMAYIGNWVLNSTREPNDHITDYDELEEKIFSHCAANGMGELATRDDGHWYASKAYEEGGIHEAISDYEDAVFFEILAEELARRDMADEPGNAGDFAELSGRIDAYMEEFEANGTANLVLEE
jgi:hypothetical protein